MKSQEMIDEARKAFPCINEEKPSSFCRIKRIAYVMGADLVNSKQPYSPEDMKAFGEWLGEYYTYDGGKWMRIHYLYDNDYDWTTFTIDELYITWEENRNEEAREK